MGRGGRAVERWGVDQRDGDSIPPAGVWKLKPFRSPHVARWSLLYGV